MYKVDVEAKTLTPLEPTTFGAMNLMERYDIQEWIDSRPEILGEDLLIIAKELVLPSGKRLDLLAVDSSGALVIVELKRDDSGSNVDWQAIKYASYCSNFSQEEIVHCLAENRDLSEEDAESEIEKFLDDGSETLNRSQRIILCAKAFHSDVASAVLWLRECGLDISCVKLEPFKDKSGNLFLIPSTIIPLPEAKDYVTKRERKDAASRRKTEFSEYIFVNVGDGPHRNWEDCCTFGFISAGGGRKFSKQLDRLKIGDKIFAYIKGCGYVGYGQVLSEAVPMRDYFVESEGKHLQEMNLTAPEAKTRIDDDENCDYVVGVQWLRVAKAQYPTPDCRYGAESSNAWGRERPWTT